jgi:hypothetical protein
MHKITISLDKASRVVRIHPEVTQPLEHTRQIAVSALDS